LEQKLLAEKTKKKLEETAQSGSVDGIIDPPSPVRRHVKWKMACTKKTGEMTTEAAKEIPEKIVSDFQLTITIIFQYFVNTMYHCVFSVQDSFEEQATQGSFVPHGRQDILAAAIGHQSTLDVSVLLEPMSPSNNTLDRLHGRPATLPPCLLTNCSS